MSEKKKLHIQITDELDKNDKATKFYIYKKKSVSRAFITFPKHTYPSMFIHFDNDIRVFECCLYVCIQIEPLKI